MARSGHYRTVTGGRFRAAKIAFLCVAQTAIIWGTALNFDDLK
jgi:hypothetical protein